MLKLSEKLLKINKYPQYASAAIYMLLAIIVSRLKGISSGKYTQFIGMPIVEVAKDTSIHIGENCVVCSNSKRTSLGVNHPVVLRTMRAGAKIEIGSNTGISGGSICAIERISIGSACLLGANVTIMDNDFHLTTFDGNRNCFDIKDLPSKPVIIGNNVFIGTCAIILKGTIIGDNSIIGAGSVVSGTVPENAIYSGNPARRIK